MQHDTDIINDGGRTEFNHYNKQNKRKVKPYMLRNPISLSHASLPVIFDITDVVAGLLSTTEIKSHVNSANSPCFL